MNHSILKKLFLFFTSLILSLSFLEVSLRTVGYFVQLNIEKEYIPDIDESNDQDNDYTVEVFQRPEATESIMCIGDSFTNGGNVQTYDTYPYFLFKDLNINSTNRYNVSNFGKCESSTFDTKDRIFEKINTLVANRSILPKKILILTGSADLFNYNFGVIREINLEEKEINVSQLFTTFRIYKMYRLIKYEVLKFFNFTNQIRLSHADVDDASLDMIKEIISLVIGKFLPRDEFPENSYSYNSEYFIGLKSKFIKKGMNHGIIKEVFPKESVPIHNYIERLLVYHSGILSRDNKYEESIKYILDFMTKYPNFFWKENNLKAVKYYLIQNVKLQSSVTPSELLKNLKSPISPNANTDFTKFVSFLSKWSTHEEKVNKLRFEAWKELILFLQKNSIEPILQTYPSNYISANNMLRKVATHFNLKIVDHNIIFQDLFKTVPKSLYLFDDDHCTPLGYELMAKNIQRVISF